MGKNGQSCLLESPCLYPDKFMSSIITKDLVTHLNAKAVSFPDRLQPYSIF